MSDPVDAYLQYLMTLPEPYRMSWNRYEESSVIRRHIHSSFPFVITIEDTLEALIDLEDYCFTAFGPRYNCFFNRWRWLGPPPDGEKVPVSYSGTWTTFSVLKSGYDFGFFDFAFKQLEDAMLFKFRIL